MFWIHLYFLILDFEVWRQEPWPWKALWCSVVTRCAPPWQWRLVVQLRVRGMFCGSMASNTIHIHVWFVCVGKAHWRQAHSKATCVVTLTWCSCSHCPDWHCDIIQFYHPVLCHGPPGGELIGVSRSSRGGDPQAMQWWQARICWPASSRFEDATGKARANERARSASWKIKILELI
jgi:hypothetical protein